MTTIVALVVTALMVVVVPLATLIVGTAILLGALFGVKRGRGSIVDEGPGIWSRILLRASGVRVVMHNPERGAMPHVFVSNHMSWFDVPVLASSLPRSKFVAKAELFKLPVFGRAIRAVGMVPIERQNRKAAFAAYDEAAERIREGNSVVVFPEGTRGDDYPLRHFKKGPFVLAIAAGASVVPVLTHGTREVMARNSWLVRPARVDVHLLEPVAVEGLGYEDRDALAVKVWSRIAEALAKHYGIESSQQTAVTQSAAAE